MSHPPPPASGRAVRVSGDGPVLPLGLRVTGRRVVVVGGGPVGLRRVTALLDAGALVTVVAPEVETALADLAARGRLEWRPRPYAAGDLDEAWLAMACTADADVNAAVLAEAEASRIWCLRADDARTASAWMPATGRSGPATVAVHADRDPRQAAALRDIALDAVAEALRAGQAPRSRPTAGPRGRVTLVGGGPGDPGLMTLRGLERLAEADVVVVDRLAPLAALDGLREDVEVVDVGKIPRGRFTPQETINALLVEHALAGRSVVRLKGGDPFVFGRGREEVDACLAAGVPVEVVPGVTYSPMAFLLMSAAFRAMDPSLEESAMMSGASVPKVAFRVTLPLVWPAIFATILILFVRSIESFEVPALLGLPVGIQVFTSSIYQAVHKYPSQVGLASAYAVTLLLITSVGVYLQSRLSSRGSKYATMTGKGFRPRQIDLGPWRHVTAAIFIVYFLLIVVLPFAVLVWSSFQRFYSVPSWQALQNLTLDPYRFILTYPNLLSAVWNSLLLAIGSAAIVMLVTSVICWIVVKTKLPGRWLLDNIASLPMVFPGLVLGLAIMIFYLNFDIGVYGTILDHVHRVRDALHALRLALQHDLDAADPQGAGGVGRDERRLVGHDVPPHRPAAVEARPGRGLHLRDDRLDPRALQLDPALQPRHGSRVGGYLGAVGERPVRRALGAGGDVHHGALRSGDDRAVAGEKIRGEGIAMRGFEQEPQMNTDNGGFRRGSAWPGRTASRTRSLESKGRKPC